MLYYLNLFDNYIVISSFLYSSESLGGGSQREVVQARKQNQQLQEENNLLKLKVELLLDMVSVKTNMRMLVLT